MLILLPPSEGKRSGGMGEDRLDLSNLGFPALSAQRATVLRAVRVLSRSVSASFAALKLGPNQRFEVDRNRTLKSSPVMPALERYAGVLYEALEVPTLSTSSRLFANDHLVVHSALFGLLRASDQIPAYRLSNSSRLPGLSLKRTWSSAVSAVLASHDGLIIDLRSEGYCSLGPIPHRANAVAVDVVAEAPGGMVRALNHFNKKGKGEFARALVESGVAHPDIESLLNWADGRGIRLTPTEPGRVQLTVEEKSLGLS